MLALLGFDPGTSGINIQHSLDRPEGLNQLARSNIHQLSSSHYSALSLSIDLKLMHFSLKDLS